MRKAYSYIRMSTEKQLNGDSLRRQKELSKQYAASHNLHLIEDFKDIGVSGFRGKNARDGVLGDFIALVKAGEVEPNSVLLVESLDRLSRDQVTKALLQFTSILEAGVEVITLSDGKRYTYEGLNGDFSQLLIGLSIMYRANEESETKSKRLKASWSNKRASALSKPLTRCGPAWLKYSEHLNQFEPDANRVAVVQRIFELCTSTCGLYGIAKYLNQNGIPMFGASKMWYRSYIKKIISSRAVLGEFQPHHTVNGKREPCGDPIQNYYPRVIEEDLFILANSALQRRDKSAKGRKGPTFTNIFAGLVYCGACGSRMVLRNRGKPPKGGKTLCCSRKQVAAGCEMPEWNLADLEKYLLQHLTEVDFSSLLDTDSAGPRIEKELQVLQTKLTEEECKREQAEKLVFGGQLSDDAAGSLVEKLNALAQGIQRIKQDIQDCRTKLAADIDARRIISSDELESLRALIAAKPDDYFLRSEINQTLSRTIDRITLYQEQSIMYPYEYEEDDAAVILYREQYPQHMELGLGELVSTASFQRFALEFHRHITVKYRTGAFREIRCGHNRSHHSVRPKIRTNLYLKSSI